MGTFTIFSPSIQLTKAGLLFITALLCLAQSIQLDNL